MLKCVFELLPESRRAREAWVCGLVAALAGSCTGAGETPTRAPTISELRVEPNPNNSLSCTVSWRTDVLAKSRVVFGREADEFQIASRGENEEHRVLVIGMVAETRYRLRAESENSAGADAQEATFETGPLPEGLPVPQLTKRGRGSQAGWTLTNAHVLRPNDGNASHLPAMVVFFDEEGSPVWYYIHGPRSAQRGDVPVEFLPNGNVLVGATSDEPPREVDLAGNVAWEGPNPRDDSEGPISHDVGKLSNGNYLVQRDVVRNGTGGVLIQELTPENEVAWSWDLFDVLVPPPKLGFDFCHGNSASVDEEGDTVYVNCRFLGVFKTTRHQPRLVWHLGGDLNPDYRGDVRYSPAGSRFTDAHDPEVQPDGRLLLFDNGGFNGPLASGEPPPRRSRVVEYQIDDDTKEARLIWEFPGEFLVDAWYRERWYTQIFGDANRLPNDNILITTGTGWERDQVTRILEVTRDGEIVWEIRLPAGTSSYQAHRVSPRPLVRKAPSR